MEPRHCREGASLCHKFAVIFSRRLWNRGADVKVPASVTKRRGPSCRDPETPVLPVSHFTVIDSHGATVMVPGSVTKRTGLLKWDSATRCQAMSRRQGSGSGWCQRGKKPRCWSSPVTIRDIRIRQVPAGAEAAPRSVAPAREMAMPPLFGHSMC